MQMGSHRLTMDDRTERYGLGQTDERISQESFFPALDGVFFSDMPTMGTSDFTTMISRIVAIPAAGEVDG